MQRSNRRLGKPLVITKALHPKNRFNFSNPSVPPYPGPSVPILGQSQKELELHFAFHRRCRRSSCRIFELGPPVRFPTSRRCIPNSKKRPSLPASANRYPAPSISPTTTEKKRTQRVYRIQGECWLVRRLFLFACVGVAVEWWPAMNDLFPSWPGPAGPLTLQAQPTRPPSLDPYCTQTALPCHTRGNHRLPIPTHHCTFSSFSTSFLRQSLLPSQLRNTHMGP